MRKTEWAELVAWLEATADEIKYGTVKISVTVRYGKVAYVKKHYKQSSKPSSVPLPPRLPFETT